ncbi:MAG: TrmH family RNA methyltransferase [Kocuria sp.]|nr:TrmH family RNA methyltransferase [Kocuria sp.]
MSGPALVGMIDDIHDPRVRKVAELLKGKNKRSRAMIVDDEENIAEAIRQSVALFTVFLSEGTVLGEELVSLLPDEVEIHVVSSRLSKELFGVERRSRVFALGRRPRPWTVAEVLDTPGDIVILDGVRLMGNIGAITRTAKALGASGILLLDSAVESLVDRRLVRASRGLVFSMPMAVTDAATVLPALDERSIRLVSLHPRATQQLASISGIPGRIALLLGSEKNGPSADLAEHADTSVTIAIDPGVESLNVSVSAALALYERSPRGHRVAGV